MLLGMRETASWRVARPRAAAALAPAPVRPQQRRVAFRPCYAQHDITSVGLQYRENGNGSIGGSAQGAAASDSRPESPTSSHVLYISVTPDAVGGTPSLMAEHPLEADALMVESTALQPAQPSAPASQHTANGNGGGHPEGSLASISGGMASVAVPDASLLPTLGRSAAREQMVRQVELERENLALKNEVAVSTREAAALSLELSEYKEEVKGLDAALVEYREEVKDLKAALVESQLEVQQSEHLRKAEAADAARLLAQQDAQIQNLHRIAREACQSRDVLQGEIQQLQAITAKLQDTFASIRAQAKTLMGTSQAPAAAIELMRLSSTAAEQATADEIALGLRPSIMNGNGHGASSNGSGLHSQNGASIHGNGVYYDVRQSSR